MPRPSVTVVLSVRNGAEFLARSIESVLAQDGVELELLVYDNGSSDGSDAIAEGYLADPRVRLTRNPPGLRFPDSMNLGLERRIRRLLRALGLRRRDAPREPGAQGRDAGRGGRRPGVRRLAARPRRRRAPRRRAAGDGRRAAAAARAVAVPADRHGERDRDADGADPHGGAARGWRIRHPPGADLRLAAVAAAGAAGRRRLAARAAGALPRARRQRLVPRLGRRHLRDRAGGHRQPGARRRALPAPSGTATASRS